MLVHWIWLSLRKGLNDREKCALLAEFADPEDLYYADESRILSLTAGKETAREALLDKNLTEAEEILAQCGKKKISILCYADRAYPDRLRSIADPPLVLYYQGSLPDLNVKPVIGVVGTRKASLYGLNTARRLGRELGEGGGIVISGLAKGIDSIAMEGALAGDGVVLGVLGCGVDVVYPRSSKNLYEATRRQGCLLSEYPPGTPPVGWHFPRRNRIISGLSLGVLVVEAHYGPGSGGPGPGRIRGPRQYRRGQLRREQFAHAGRGNSRDLRLGHFRGIQRPLSGYAEKSHPFGGAKTGESGAKRENSGKRTGEGEKSR